MITVKKNEINTTDAVHSQNKKTKLATCVGVFVNLHSPTYLQQV